MKAIFYAASFFLFLIFASSNAYACSCGEMTQSEEFKRSESVFIGEFVERIEGAYIDEPSVKLKITKSWKGAKAGKLLSLVYIDLDGCNYDINFTEGKKYLIYAVPSKGGLFISVDCGRSRAIEDAKEDIENMDKVAKKK